MNVLRFAYVLSHGNLHIIDVWLKRMESKKKLPYDPQEVPKAKRFRANLSDAFLSGEVSGQRSHSLFSDAMDAGAANVSDLAGNHQPGMKCKRFVEKKFETAPMAKALLGFHPMLV